MLITASTLAIKYVPIQRWAGLIGARMKVPAEMAGAPIQAPPCPATDVSERRVGVAIVRAGRRLPWEPSCLADAVAAQLMLRRRGQPGAMVMGLKLAEQPGQPGRAHAWAMSKSGCIAGGQAAPGYTPVTIYNSGDWITTHTGQLTRSG